MRREGQKRQRVTFTRQPSPNFELRTPNSKRVGLFGGTFNPIHLGHLRAGVEIQETFALDHLLFIPTAIPPHKKSTNLLPFAQRWKMLQLAIDGYPFFKGSDVEKRRAGKSYSIQTLRFFKKKYGHKVELYFIIGIDAFWEINTWREFHSLFILSHFIVMDRPGYSRKRIKEFLTQNVSPEITYYPRENRFLHPGGFSIYLFSVPLMDISSTRIRSLRQEKRAIRYLVPEKVEDHIMRKNLYAS
jgi:nicotinate-nucleotide adenylyltransferase